jgi:hypothetical protein
MACKSEKEEISPLIGTTWKLVGFVDAATGTLTVAEPSDCESCYTLTFDSNSTASGISIINHIRVDLSSKPFIAVHTKVDDSMNGNVQLLYDAMEKVDSYKIEKDELRFYYNSNKNYLLYKLIQQ